MKYQINIEVASILLHHQYFEMNNSPLRIGHSVRSDNAKVEGL